MAKTIRSYEVDKAAEKKFGARLLKLTERVSKLEKQNLSLQTKLDKLLGIGVEVKS